MEQHYTVEAVAVMGAIYQKKKKKIVFVTGSLILVDCINSTTLRVVELFGE